MKYLDKRVLRKLNGKRCLLRLSLNVTNEEIKSSIRISQSAEAIEELSKAGAIVIAFGHRGRPDLGKLNKKEYKKELSLKSVTRYLSKRVGMEIEFFNDFDFEKIKKKIDKAKNGKVFMLENVRFLDKELKNSQKLASLYSILGDIYINDAFSVAHRKEASVDAIARIMKSYGGTHFKDEIMHLTKVMESFKKPLVLIMGGAKVSDKLSVINNFIKKADKIILGGVMATIYFASKGLPVNGSIYDKDLVSKMREWGDNKKIIPPDDFIFDEDRIFDIGEKSCEKFKEIIQNAKTIVWNGPMGMIEKKKFSAGTACVAEAINNAVAYSIIGGGETTEFLKKSGFNKKISFISAGGGAMLKFLSGEKLPAIEALKFSSRNNF